MKAYRVGGRPSMANDDPCPRPTSTNTGIQYSTVVVGSTLGWMDARPGIYFPLKSSLLGIYHHTDDF